MSWKPEEDGITHINVYSQGRTPLGKALSNFANISFEHPEDGVFCSVEGYWYWLSTKDDLLRTMAGYKAKDYGRSIRGLDWPQDPEFEKKIKQALFYKVTQNPPLLDALVESQLPLVHYYVFKDKVIEPKEGLWILSFLMEMREHYQQEGVYN